MKKYPKLFIQIISYSLLLQTLTGCGDTGSQSPIPSETLLVSEEESFQPDESVTQSENIQPTNTPSADSDVLALRDNTPVCLVPTAPGNAFTGNDVAVIDYSNASEGYIMANYSGSCPKVKLRIVGPDEVVYTYDLHGETYEAFPLSSGDGDYDVTIYENISGTSYSTCLYEKVTVLLSDAFSPFLYPNQYVNFTADSKTVQKGALLAKDATNDLEVISNIYNYIISNITYDYDKAADPPTGYVTDVDTILESGTGICLDYAAVMASMLRSQRIPTRLEVGYAKDAYHAWISVYIEDIGWLNGIISFDGNTWTLIDPTFGAGSDDNTLKKFIGDGSNYVLQKMY